MVALWDKKQNFKSVAPYTLEEAYEVLDAIEREDFEDLQEELGDLLFQIVFFMRKWLRKSSVFRLMMW